MVVGGLSEGELWVNAGRPIGELMTRRAGTGLEGDGPGRARGPGRLHERRADSARGRRGQPVGVVGEALFVEGGAGHGRDPGPPSLRERTLNNPRTAEAGFPERS